MKLGKLSLTISALALALGLCLQPNIGWSTRAFEPPVTGTITASPSSNSVEVDHHVYPVKAGSTAAKVLISLYVGEVVDMTLDGPPGSTPEVINITPHQG